jgi:hypothetical protein
MGFDKEWFNELRQLSDQAIAVINPKSFRPTVDELVTHDLVSNNFLNSTLELVKGLNKTKFPFSPLFRVYPGHICNFPRGKAFRKQWNIGFYAGDDPSQDCTRIGIGFSLNKEMSQQGIDEYVDFIEKIAEHPEKFDSTFHELGNYAEPHHLLTQQPLSSTIIADQPNFNDDWRFFGKILVYSSEHDRSILNSIDMFIDESAAVFDHINQSGFA